MEIEGNVKNTQIEKKSYKKLFDFLQDHKYDKNVHLSGFTHTRIGDREANIYGGTYYIPDDELDMFHKLYFQFQSNYSKSYLYLINLYSNYDFFPVNQFVFFHHL